MLTMITISGFHCTNFFSVTTTTAATSTWQRSARYARYDPPKIVPTNDFQTVKAGTTYTFRSDLTFKSFQVLMLNISVSI